MHGQTWRTLVVRERSQRNARTGSLKYTAILYNVKRQKVWAGYQQHLLQYSSKNSEQNLNQTSAATVAQACECQASTGSSLKANGVCWLGKQSLWESGSCNHLWFLSCLILVKFSAFKIPFYFPKYMVLPTEFSDAGDVPMKHEGTRVR